MRNVSRCKRGQASAIGAVLFLALAVLMVAFSQEVFQTQTTMNEVDVERFQEKVVITSAYIASDGKLVLNMTNQGSVTANLVRLWVVDLTDNQFFSFNFVNLYIQPGARVSNVSSINFELGKRYSIRVATERGNIASYNLVPAVHARINIQASSTNLIGNNVTVVLSITNNDTSGNSIYNLVPQLTVSPGPSLILKEGPAPSRVDLLPAGSSAYFVYVYKVTGSGFTITLNGTFQNAPEGNYALAKIYATAIDVTAEVTTMPVFHLDAFGSVPALLDSQNNVYTYWGVSVVNPYNRTIKVFSTAVIATSSAIFAPGTLVGVNPTTGWSARSTSIFSGVFWDDGGSPISIPPFSVYNFTFRIQVDAPAGFLLETPINIEAVTTEGKFIKNYATSSDGTYPAINLYLTKTPSNPTASKTYALTEVPSSFTQTYNVTIYNSGRNDLNSKVNLLIRVPVGWADVSAASQTGWSFPSQSITQQEDGSWLITVESSSSMLADGTTLVYQFTATTPAVTYTTLYTLAVTAYYPGFSPSITAAYLSAVIQVVP